MEEINLKEISKKLKGEKIVAIDFGLKRVGIAYTDELHISINTKNPLDFTSDNFWEQLEKILNEIKTNTIVVGMPFRDNPEENPFIKEVQKFINEIEKRFKIKPIVFDEAFSSKRAEKTMIEIGVKKKKRREKSKIDSISAGIILRDFLNALEIYEKNQV